MLNGESRGSPQANDAAMGNADIALLDIDSDTDHLINNNKTYSAYSHTCQCEKLAEHTVVHPRGSLRQMAVAVVLHTVGTLRRSRRCYVLMDM